MKRRIIRDLALDKIAVVDNPCQEGAKMTIMKRAEPSLADKIVKQYIDPADGAKPFSEFLENSMERDRYWEIQSEFGPLLCALDESLRSVAGDKSLSNDEKTNMMRSSADEFLKAVRDKWPDVEEAVEKSFTRGEQDMATKTVDELQKELDGLNKQLEAAKGDGAKAAELQKQVDELTKSVTELTSKLEKAEAEKAEAAAKAGMSDTEKAYYDGLPDDEARKQYMAMKPEDRKKQMKKAADADEVITIEGQEVRKSAVGEAQFKVMKAQAERIAKQEEAIAKERDLRVEAQLTKRATDELPHMPGEIVAKVAVLKAVDAMPEDARKSLTEMLKAGNDALSPAFVKMGAKDGKGGSRDPSAFEKRVSEIISRDKLARTEAMQKARSEYPEEFKAYQESAQQAA